MCFLAKRQDLDSSGNVILFLFIFSTESEEESAGAGGNVGTNTLKEQIKKQRKKIINQSFDEKASR